MLDGGYPDPVTTSTQGVPNDTHYDGPSDPLYQIDGEHAISFNASTYLMWTPGVDNRCTAGTDCTIPVPLGSATWSLTGDAINTLIPNFNNSQTTWDLMSCSYPKAGEETVTFTPGTTYPPPWNGTSCPAPGGCDITCP
jgi:hypothetical protein